MLPSALQNPWFFCEEITVGPAHLDPQESHHVFHTRRHHVGDEIALFNGRGQVARATIHAAPTGKGKALSLPADAVQIDEVFDFPPLTPSLTLLTAAPKGSRLDTLVEECTEIGVHRIVLINYARAVVAPRPKHIAKLNRTALEACKQCRRPWRPDLAVAPSLAAALESTPPVAALADHGPDAITLDRWIAQHPDDDLAIAIGPEGGFDAAEYAAARAADLPVVLLAPHVLRTETAAIAAAAQVCPRQVVTR